MALSLLALGSNLGDRPAILRQACSEISRFPKTRLLARSSWYETTPVGGPEGQPAFLNGAIIVSTQLTPVQLASNMHSLEKHLGRVRDIRWGSRVIDIDLLLYDQVLADLPSLTLPHPRMLFRRFVMQPAAEIASDWLHPDSGWTLGQIYSNLEKLPRKIALISSDRMLLEWLAEKLLNCFEYTRYSPSETKDAPIGAGNIGDAPIKPEHFYRLHLQFPAGDEKKSPTISNSDTDVSFVINLTLGLSKKNPTASSGRFDTSIRPEKKNYKKNKKKILGENPNFLEIKPLGPMAYIRADDRQSILHEVVAAIGSAWPDLYCSLTALD